MGCPEMSINPISDSDVLLGHQESVASADRTAIDFDQLFAQYQSIVYRMAFRMLNNRDDALEVTQEVFLLIFRKIDLFRGQSSLTTWIYRITVNQSYNRMRWWKSRRVNATQSIQGMDPGPLIQLNLTASCVIPTPEQVMEGTQVAEKVSLCIQRVPVKYRTVLLMKDMEGLSYDDIATALDISIGTVKSRLARGREQLRRFLDHCG